MGDASFGSSRWHRLGVFISSQIIGSDYGIGGISLTNQRKSQVALGTGALSILGATQACAEGVADAAVVSAFTSASDTVVATMGALVAVGLAVFVCPLAIRYGKKMFQTAAR